MSMTQGCVMTLGHISKVTVHTYPKFSHVDLEVWPTFKNFNLGHKLLTVRERAFIFHMCIPCDKTFHTIP